MSNGDCPVGARNQANIGNVTREVDDMAGRLRSVEIDMAKLKMQLAGYAAAGAFIASIVVQVGFKILG